MDSVRHDIKVLVTKTRYTVHALTHLFVLMVHDPVKLMAQIKVFPYVIVCSHDLVDKQKQITVMLLYNA